MGESIWANANQHGQSYIQKYCHATMLLRTFWKHSRSWRTFWNSWLSKTICGHLWSYRPFWPLKRCSYIFLSFIHSYMATRPYGRGSQMKNGEASLLTEPIYYHLMLTQKRRIMMKRCNYQHYTGQAKGFKFYTIIRCSKRDES